MHGKFVNEPGSSAPQGIEFHTSFDVSNPNADAQNANVRFSIEDAAGKPVFFKVWYVSVPPGETVNIPVGVTSSQWFDGTGLFTLKAEIGNIQSGETSYRVTHSPIQVPRFENVAEQAGVNVELPVYECGRWWFGAGWSDVDVDGDLDLLIARGSETPALYINDGNGHFTDEAADRGVTNSGGELFGVTFGDYDNDGDPDLYLMNNFEDRLYRNDGMGNFDDVTPSSGIVADKYAGSSGSWGDYDNDGYIDLYVANYGHCDAGTMDYHPDKLYHNNGDGTFTDVTELVENDPATREDGGTDGAGFQMAWFDIDGDRDLDIYLANDFWNRDPDANHMWRNDGMGDDGQWVFTDVSVASRTRFAMNAMGIGIADYDRDKDLDFALSNIHANRLMRNEGDGTFKDVAEPLGVKRPEQHVGGPSTTWGLAFADLNLDQWEDLFVVSGALVRPDDHQPDEVFVNDKGQRFLDLSAPSQADDDRVGRGMAFADWDQDGRMDLVVVQQDAPTLLYRNVTPRKDRHWLEVDLVGTTSNRDACGAIVFAWTGKGRPMMRQVMCGSVGLASYSDPTVHLGLGSNKTVKKLKILWPAGGTQTLHSVKGDRHITIEEAQ
jgi:hypothetical protein